VENYFNYFTEIEEHFQRRRGTLLILSTLDWALIETWKDAGIPLEAALRGIDATFDKWDRKPAKTRKVNGLGFCAQEVLAAAEDMKEAAVGAQPSPIPAGIDHQEIAAFLEKNASALEKATLPDSATVVAKQHVEALRELASVVRESTGSTLEDLERRLTVMEERLQAALLAASPDEQLVEIRAQADRELAPYRRNMPAAQIDQLHKQYLNKRLLERYGLPRLSLFYM
jgi:hypothetical protein